MEQAYRWNEYVAFASNMTTNLILITLISAKSPPELSNYRRMLYLSCGFDIFLTAMSLTAMLVSSSESSIRNRSAKRFSNW